MRRWGSGWYVLDLLFLALLSPLSVRLYRFRGYEFWLWVALLWAKGRALTFVIDCRERTEAACF